MDTKSTGYLLAAPLAGLALLALTGCASFAGLGAIVGDGAREQHYAEYRDTPYWSDQFETSPPAFVPEDATGIRIRYADDAKAMRYDAAEETVAEGCEPTAIEGRPSVGGAWWPELSPAEGLRCGDWTSFRIGGTTYAWTEGAAHSEALD